MSPGGVTTRIDEPAQSTEEQYGQACLAAKDAEAPTLAELASRGEVFP
jgi:hypothetical protein